jgi:hypothetical protein
MIFNVLNQESNFSVISSLFYLLEVLPLLSADAALTQGLKHSAEGCLVILRFLVLSFGLCYLVL